MKREAAEEAETSGERREEKKEQLSQNVTELEGNRKYGWANLQNKSFLHIKTPRNSDSRVSGHFLFSRV